MTFRAVPFNPADPVQAAWIAEWTRDYGSPLDAFKIDCCHACEVCGIEYVCDIPGEGESYDCFDRDLFDDGVTVCDGACAREYEAEANYDQRKNGTL
jgi:hypothetical protein